MTSRNKLKNFIERAIVITFWILLWQLVYMMISQKLLLPSPSDVFTRLFYLLPEDIFWISVFNTLSRILLGFVSAIVVGTVLAAASVMPPVRLFLSPAVSVVKSTPVASITILALVWIKSYQLSAFISFMMVLPIIYESVYHGISAVDKNLTEMARVFGVPVGRRILGIYVHSVRPFLVSAASTGLGFAWKSGVAAEVIGLPNNTVGIRLYESKIQLETADLFAWTIVIILISAAMEKIFIRVIEKIS